jgi:hypothetical protein
MNVVPIQQEIDLGEPKFSDFWLLWLKKEKRKDAERLFLRLRDENKMLALIAAAEWRQVWMDRDEEFWPTATKWLEGDRWEDAIPARYRKTQSHETFKPRDDTPKSAMPEHVRLLIAKLRGK